MGPSQLNQKQNETNQERHRKRKAAGDMRKTE